jgi:hypothetical protein
VSVAATARPTFAARPFATWTAVCGWRPRGGPGSTACACARATRRSRCSARSPCWRLHARGRFAAPAGGDRRARLGRAHALHRRGGHRHRHGGRRARLAARVPGEAVASCPSSPRTSRSCARPTPSSRASRWLPCRRSPARSTSSTAWCAGGATASKRWAGGWCCATRGWTRTRRQPRRSDVGASSARRQHHRRDGLGPSRPSPGGDGARDRRAGVSWRAGTHERRCADHAQLPPREIPRSAGRAERPQSPAAAVRRVAVGGPLQRLHQRPVDGPRAVRDVLGDHETPTGTARVAGGAHRRGRVPRGGAHRPRGGQLHHLCADYAVLRQVLTSLNEAVRDHARLRPLVAKKPHRVAFGAAGLAGLTLRGDPEMCPRSPPTRDVAPRPRSGSARPVGRVHAAALLQPRASTAQAPCDREALLAAAATLDAARCPRAASWRAQPTVLARQRRSRGARARPCAVSLPGAPAPWRSRSGTPSMRSETCGYDVHYEPLELTGVASCAARGRASAPSPRGTSPMRDLGALR